MSSCRFTFPVDALARKRRRTRRCGLIFNHPSPSRPPHFSIVISLTTFYQACTQAEPNITPFCDSQREALFLMSAKLSASVPPSASLPPPTSLLSTIRSALTALAPPRPLIVHVFKSAPRRVTSIYAHAVHPPKNATVEDILVHLYIRLTPEDMDSLVRIEKSELEGEEGTAGVTKSSPSLPPTLTPVLLVALEANVYTVPTTSTTLIYISKMDTTGFPAPSPSRPYAKTVVASFLAHYLAEETRPTRAVQVHLFARAQPQYLFPDSGTEPGRKKMLGSGQLCKWWRTVLEEVAPDPLAAAASDGTTVRVRRQYILPGLMEQEVAVMFGVPKESWLYELVSVPSALLPLPSSSTRSSSQLEDGEGDTITNTTMSNSTTSPPPLVLIPTFPDDPRTRFLDELALGSSPSIPAAKSSSSSSTHHAPFTSSSSNPTETHAAAQHAASHAVRTKATAQLAKIPIEEFYERLAFRQECSLGATVGFFAVSSTSEDSKYVGGATTLTLKPTSSASSYPGLSKDLWLRLYSTMLNQSFATDTLTIKGPYLPFSISIFLTLLSAFLASAMCWDASRALLGGGGGGGDTTTDQLANVEAGIEADPSAVLSSGLGKRKLEGADEVGGEAPKGAVMAPVVSVLQVRKKKKVE